MNNRKFYLSNVCKITAKMLIEGILNHDIIVKYFSIVRGF